MAIPAIVVILGLFARSLFDPSVAPWVFIGPVLILDAWLLVTDVGNMPPPTRLNIQPHEEATWQRHKMFLMYPAGSSEICAALQMTRWSAVLWVPWLLYCTDWLTAGLVVLHFVITASVSTRMNPLGPYELEAQRGNATIAEELEVLRELLGRLHDV